MSGCEFGVSQMRDGQKLRIYTRDECENKLGGNYFNGECFKSDGSGYSYTWECRDAPNSVISSVAASLSGGGTSSGIPSWALYAGGAGAILLAWKMLGKK